MSHPRDWPALACPECGKPGLLTPAYVLAEVIDCPGPAVRVPAGMGGGITTPVVASSGDEPQAFCNYSACGWTGTIKEAKCSSSS